MIISNPASKPLGKILVTHLNQSIPAAQFVVPAGCYAKMTLTVSGTISGSTMPLATLYLGGTFVAGTTLKIVPSSTIGHEVLQIELDEGTYNWNSTATGWAAGGGNMSAYGLYYKKT